MDSQATTSLRSEKCGQPSALLSRRRQTFKFSNGYIGVQLSMGGKITTHLVHRLVARAFIPTEDTSLVVNHKDSCRHNNWRGNLEWVTQGDNLRHGYSHGHNRGRRGSGSHLAKLTEESVREIRRLLQEGQARRHVAEQFGISQTTMHNIGLGKTWRHVV
jgi:hypothetical protein